MYKYIFKDTHLDLKPLINRKVTIPLASSSRCSRSRIYTSRKTGIKKTQFFFWRNQNLHEFILQLIKSLGHKSGGEIIVVIHQHTHPFPLLPQKNFQGNALFFHVFVNQERYSAQTASGRKSLLKHLGYIRFS